MIRCFPPIRLLLLAALLAFAPACTPGAEAPDAPEATPQAAAPEVPAPATELGPAPAFTLPTLDGDSLALADLRGRVVLVNFWATWCAPCVAEMPDLSALHEEFDGLTVVGVAVDEGPELVRPFAENLDVRYPIVLDDGGVAEAFGGVWALPTTYVIGTDGIIVQRIIGLFPVEEMRPQLRRLLDARG